MQLSPSLVLIYGGNFKVFTPYYRCKFIPNNHLRIRNDGQNRLAGMLKRNGLVGFWSRRCHIALRLGSQLTDFPSQGTVIHLGTRALPCKCRNRLWVQEPPQAVKRAGVLKQDGDVRRHCVQELPHFLDKDRQGCVYAGRC